MSNERETKKLTCPSGKTVEIKSYLTARENRDIRDAYLGTVTPKFDGKGNVIGSSVESGNLRVAEEKAIEVGVIAFDESRENVLTRILDGSYKDYEFILRAINEMRETF